MKDDKLEKQFDEYFDGLNTPDNITADAKKYVKRKSAFLPKFVKFASVAASFALVLTASLLIIFGTRTSYPDDGASVPNNGALTPDDSAQAPDSVQSPDSAGNVTYYSDADLSFEQTDVYGVSEARYALKFIQTFSFSGANVGMCSAGYMNGELAVFKTEVSLISGLSRHDTQICVEFTGKNTVYSPLKEYTQGEKRSFSGVDYFLTRETAENGEPVNKLYFTYGGVKYYFNVASSDENAYLQYLHTVIK